VTSSNKLKQIDIRFVERGIRRTAALYLLRLWPFGVTWRHRSRDHWTRNMWFPISDPLKPLLHLAWLLRYCVSNI